jgi:MFS transporter, DHA1 family, inner membrane transport protein
LREALAFTPREAGLAVSSYGLGGLFSLVGGWLGDRYDYHKLLFGSFVASAITGAILFSGLGHSLPVHVLLSFIFGVAMSGMVYANLSAGVIKSVKREHASYASGLFVASLYIPAAFAGYLLGVLKENFGWSTAGIIQIAGCALVAAMLPLLAEIGRRRVAVAQ